MNSPQSNEDRSFSIVIGLREIYDLVRDATVGISSLNQKMDGISKDLMSTQLDTAALEIRLRTLEQRPVVTPTAMWSAIGVIATVAGTIAAIIAFMTQR